MRAGMFRLLLVVGVVFLTVDAVAQTTFGPRRIIVGPAVANPEDVISADVDGDGDLDVLTASSQDDKIAWYENADGLGAFGPQHIISTEAEEAESIYAADLDGDGDVDVLSASGSILADKIAWYENTDGNGTFGPQQVISTDARFASSVFAADLDGDGDLDALSASSGDDTIAWYENIDGHGSFGSQRVISSDANWAKCVYAADLDGDGDADVLSASRDDGKIAWYENVDGAGTFGPQQVISADASGALSGYAADLDGDGDVDVISASSWDNKIAWYENTDGLGTFGPQIVISTETNGAEDVHVGDLDGDGDLDVLSASPGNDRIAWYENTDGLGNFGPQQVVTSVGDGANAVHAADLDGDGDLDVLSSSRNDDKILWNANTDGLGNFGPWKVVTLDHSGLSFAIAADLDDDGDADVLASSRGDDKIAWYQNVDGAGSFGPQSLITNRVVEAVSTYAADLDGDGDKDALSASSGDDQIAWYENTDGLGAFGPMQVITDLALEASCVRGADIDGDGDMDVLSASWLDRKIAWYENTDGLASFGPQQVISIAANGAESVYATDIDGDGDMDVLSASSNDNKIAWYENTDGLGAFGPQNVITTNAEEARCVHAADIDGDGDADVLSASEADDKIAWYENTDGLGGFGPQQVISADADGAKYVYAADMDGDGDIDVLSASYLDYTIGWHENEDGLGSFGARQIITQDAVLARSVYGADLDGDGDIDVLTASIGDEIIAWHENMSPHCEMDGQPCDFGAGQDGDMCNSVCTGGVCIPGDPFCDDGDQCNGTETCDSLQGCIAGTAPVCDDGDWCNGAESCDATDGCVPGTPPVCDDGLDCTLDTCDEALDVCTSSPDHDACSNGLFCDGTEFCDLIAGCQPGGGNPCIPPTECDEQSDTCVGCSQDIHCDDGIDCTSDACDAGQCVSTPDDGACDDGLYCNGMETCDSHSGCVVGTPPCQPPAACDEASDSCSVENAAPEAPTLLEPEDGAEVDSQMPRLTVSNATDPDGDVLTYQFQVLVPDSETVIWEATAVTEGARITSVWVDSPLDDSQSYQWRARARDDQDLDGAWSPRAMFHVVGASGSRSGCSCGAEGAGGSFSLVLLILAAALPRRGRSGSASSG